MAHAATTQNIVIAEDDFDDRLLIEDAFAELSFSKVMLEFANNGKALLELLHQKEVLPAFVLLDLNMPQMDGKETLCALKHDPYLKLLPVIIFTSSSSPQDIKLCYENGSNTFMTKPPNFKELVSTLDTIATYWFDKACLPAY